MAKIVYTTQQPGPGNGFDLTTANIFSTVLDSPITLHTPSDLRWSGSNANGSWQGDVLGTGIVPVMNGTHLTDVTAGHLTGLVSHPVAGGLATDITVSSLNADAAHFFDLVFAQRWGTLLAYITRGADNIFGAQGNDTIKAGAGNDHVYGGGGRDKLDGGLGNDALFGGAGNDTLIGGLGADSLTGGAGADKFEFVTLTDPTGPDRITDFTHGLDHIVLHSTTIAGIGGPGPLDPIHFNSTATTADTVILYDHATGWISYDADGSGPGHAVEVIKVLAGITIDATDFLVV